MIRLSLTKSIGATLRNHSIVQRRQRNNAKNANGGTHRDQNTIQEGEAAGTPDLVGHSNCGHGATLADPGFGARPNMFCILRVPISLTKGRVEID